MFLEQHTESDTKYGPSIQLDTSTVNLSEGEVTNMRSTEASQSCGKTIQKTLTEELYSAYNASLYTY